VSRREEILSTVRSVPSLPAAAAEVVRLIRDPEVGIAEISRAIEHDPGLTSNLLRMANSAYFGIARSVGSVQEAAVCLGTKRIFQMVIASAVSPLVQRPVKGYDLPAGKLWEHSVCVAAGAEQLAEELKLEAPSHLFTAGLLHDVGKLVLGTFVDVDAGPIMALAFDEEMSFEVAEAQVLGINHAEVGAALLDSWNLPKEIVDADRWHHDPEAFPGDDTLVVDLVHVADALSMMQGIGAGSDGLNYRSCAAVTERLKLKTAVTEVVACHTVAKLGELRDLFTHGKGR